MSNGYFMGNPRCVIKFHLIFIIKKMNYECSLSADSAGKQRDDVLTPCNTRRFDPSATGPVHVNKACS